MQMFFLPCRTLVSMLPTGAQGHTVALLMQAFRRGDSGAAGTLVELLYPELRRIAAGKMQHERSEHSWQPTVLVNELYLELIKIRALDANSPDAGSEKQAFLGLAGHLMHRLLIHHSRPAAYRAKRLNVDFDSGLELPGDGSPVESLQNVEDLLDKLAAIDPKFRIVVEMRVFEGSTGEEIAARLGCSLRSVNTYWKFAKHWLRQEYSRTVATERAGR